MRCGVGPARSEGRPRGRFLFAKGRARVPRTKYELPSNHAARARRTWRPLGRAWAPKENKLCVARFLFRSSTLFLPIFPPQCLNAEYYSICLQKQTEVAGVALLGGGSLLIFLLKRCVLHLYSLPSREQSSVNPVTCVCV